MLTKRLLIYAKVTFAVVVWGLSFIATKVVLQDVSPMILVWLRFGIGTFILGASVIKRRLFNLPNRKDLPYLFFLGLQGITFHQWLQSTGLVTAKASTTAWLVATAPVFMVLIGRFIFRETITYTKLIGISLATVGAITVVSAGNFTAVIRGKIGSPGDSLILISALNWSIFSALSRRGLKTYPAVFMLFYVVGSGWLFSSILLFVTDQNLIEVISLSLPGWLGVLFLGIACSGVAYLCWYDALQVLPVSQVGAFLYVEPLVTIVVAKLLLEETIGPASLVGGGAILLGVWLANRPG